MRILLIAPAFYDYHTRIIDEMKNQGHEVVYFAERPVRLIYSMAKKLPKKLKNWIFNQYLQNILNTIGSQQFDLTLVIRGEIVQPWFILSLRKLQQRCRFVMYQWDSLRVVSYQTLIPLFDAIATFDSVDAEQLEVPYLPLFFVPEYRLSAIVGQAEVDLTFVGSYHESRYQTLKTIQTYCIDNQIRFDFVLYMSILDYVKLRLMGKFPPLYNELTFRKLNQTDIVNLYKRSSGILDIENQKQSGLTMRTFEVLATERLLVTTNHLAPILLPELSRQIIVVDQKQLTLQRAHLSKVIDSDDGLARYSLSSWTSGLLSL